MYMSTGVGFAVAAVHPKLLHIIIIIITGRPSRGKRLPVCLRFLFLSPSTRSRIGVPGSDTAPYYTRTPLNFPGDDPARDSNR